MILCENLKSTNFKEGNILKYPNFYWENQCAMIKKWGFTKIFENCIILKVLILFHGYKKWPI